LERVDPTAPMTSAYINTPTTTTKIENTICTVVYGRMLPPTPVVTLIAQKKQCA
jgi:hypothetical protein